MNQHVSYLWQMPFCLKLLLGHTDRTQRIDCSTWTTEVVGKNKTRKLSLGVAPVEY